MTLPTFRSLAARRQAKKEREEDGLSGIAGEDISSGRTLTPETPYVPGVNIKVATKTRRNAIVTSSIFFLLAVIFTILTMIGNVNTKAVIRSTWFFELNLTNILPASAENIVLINSLARSLGLHDFYRVGLWNFCEGYNDQGVTHCSKPKALYWFNPVEILLNELLAGATIALPANINNILELIKIVSHLMFGFFITGVCMNFVSIFITPIVLRSRWWSLPIAIWTFIAALLTTAACIIATVMFIIFKTVITSQDGLNIGASLGTQIFVFMWIGAAFSVLGFITHIGLCCCCASRRDVRTGRRKGNKAAYGDANTDEKKKPLGGKFAMPKFGRKKTESQES